MSAVAGHVIGGRVESPQGCAVIEVVNPADGAVVGAVVSGDAGDVDRAVAAARAALPGWAAAPMEERIRIVEALAAGLDEHRERLAATLTAEMGTPIAFARAAQVGVAIADLRQLIAAAREHVSAEAVSNSLVVTEPVGVVAAITPWNFPLHQIMLKLGGALLAGCTVVLKPSEVAPLNAVIVAEILDAIGLPAGVVDVVFGDGPAVGEPLAAHPDVDMVTFTGSRAVGERIARAASATVTRVALELGGKSAAVILDDAPLEASVAGVLASCFANAGQTCAALTRALVPETIKSRWEDAAVAAAQTWMPGDPRDEDTRMGPLASAAQHSRVVAHITRAQEEGARLLVGGTQALEIGEAYVRPTIFTDVDPDMALFRDEVFGPVLAITGYRTIDEAVALANDSDYGLSGGVWSADEVRALEIALRLRTGTVGINGAGLDVGAPFGGYKQSGLGREAGRLGFEEFLEVKSVMGAAHLVKTS
ncbi:aldehyde dehydrogenase family protein [Microbacterium sp. KR10-403]|uniref:aldehyde dehydrogenase family protein n=1 Tax=Microbacterium sp. KR10-403 TaxID=3158581 RepID=UPI0032E46135